MRKYLILALFVIGCGGEGEVVGEIESVPPDQHEEPEEERHCYTTKEKKLVAFLKSFDDKYHKYDFVIRWEDAPLLMIAEGHSDREREVVGKAVNSINSSLPSNYHIKISKETAPDNSDTVSDGHIYVNFGDVSANCRNISTACSKVYSPSGTVFNKNDPVISAEIWLRPIAKRVGDCDEEGWRLVLIHELVHTLGLIGHPQPKSQWQSESIMVQGKKCTRYERDKAREEGLFPQKDLGILDQDGLRAVYSSLENGDDPEELRIEPEAMCGEWGMLMTQEGGSKY